MPKEKPVEIVESIGNKEKLTVEEALSKYSGVDMDSAGANALSLLSAFLMGEILFDKEKVAILKTMMGQFLPNAGTNINVNVKIRPEEYLAKAMEENTDSYLELVDNAKKRANELQDDLRRRAESINYEVKDG